MSRPANAIRGEAEIRIDGDTVVLRPSFENLVAAEEELGSLFGMVERASQGGVTLAEVTALVWHCVELDPRPSREVIGKAVLAMGLVEATRPVRAILAQVLQGQT